MATFTWTPDFGAQLVEKPRVHSVRFGERGFEAREVDGINTLPEVWTLTFNSRTDSERDAILAFLRARAGLESFDWTSPVGTVGKWVCREWGASARAVGVNDAGFMFEQVFE